MGSLFIFLRGYVFLFGLVFLTQQVVSIPTSFVEENEIDSQCANWMSYHRNKSAFELPCLPATHNSAASKHYTNTWISSLNPIWQWARNQSLDIPTQLNFGVRLLDIRISEYSNEMYISHTAVSDLTLKKFLGMVRSFLEKHKSEFVVIMIRKDYHGNLRNFEKVRNILWESKIDWAKHDDDYFKKRVKELAGQAILVCDEEGDEGIFKDVSPCSLPPHWNRSILFNQDYADIWRNSSIASAQGKISKHLSKTRAPTPSRLGGIALDGHFAPMPPSYTSPGLNQWFFDNLTAETWPNVTAHIGVVTLDFVTKNNLIDRKSVV